MNTSLRSASKPELSLHSRFRRHTCLPGRWTPGAVWPPRVSGKRFGPSIVHAQNQYDACELHGFTPTVRGGAAARCGTLAGPRASRCGRFVVYLPADPPSASVDPPSASMEATSASTATLGGLQLSGQLLLGLLLWRPVCDG